MKLQEAMNMMLLEVTMQRLQNYLQSAQDMISKGNVDGAVKSLAQMAKSTQDIQGRFEATEQSKVQSLSSSIRSYLEKNQDKIADRKVYSQAVNSLNNLDKMLQSAKANLVKSQQVTKQRMAPKSGTMPRREPMPTM